MRITPSGLSIGTGLALETILDIPRFDPRRKIPQIARPITYYDTLYVNALTLVRNAISTISSAEKNIITASEIADFCAGEIRILESIVPIRVEVFLSKYSKLAKTEAKIYRREPSTPKQHQYVALLNLAVSKLLVRSDIKQYQWLIPSTQNKVMFLTHIVTDLYCYKHQTDIALLESNTGTVKTVSQFASKYWNVPIKAVPYVPFNLRSQLLIGDSNVIKPMTIQVRLEFFKAATEFKWTANTTEKKVSDDLNGSQFKLAASFYSLISTL